MARRNAVAGTRTTFRRAGLPGLPRKARRVARCGTLSRLARANAELVPECGTISLLARATRELVPEHGTSSSLARATRDLVPQDSARVARYSARYCGDTSV